MVPRLPGEVVIAAYFRRADFDQWSLSEGCPQQSHSETCGWRIEALLKGGLAAADERINRALADAVERHATEDP